MIDRPVRLPDWEDRLSNYFANCAEARFVWGRMDCALFAAGAVKAMTGVDLAADYRGQYSDMIGAAEMLRVLGSGTLVRTWIAALGATKSASQAKRGDIVLHNGSVGVCAGKFSLFVGSLDETANMLSPDEYSRIEGLIPVLTTNCTRAWTVAF